MAGAAKPGSTLPPQGGKGGVQSPRPTLAPAQGASMPAQGGKAQPSNTLPAPGQAATVPAQGKGAPSNVPGYAQPYIGALPPQVQQPAPGQLPPQGGKSQAQIDQMNADIAARQANNGVGISKMFYAAGGGQQPTTTDFGQPQVPAQGGKAPLTPEQHAAISANADPARGLGLNLGDMLYGGGGQQLAPGQVAPTQAEIDRLRPMLTTPMAQTPSNLPSYTQPAYNDLMTQDKAAKLAEMERMRAGQVPAPVQQSNQAGQAEKLAYMQSVLNASRPQVQQPAPAMPRPAMPRPARPTMTRPSLIGAGLAGLRGRR